jgi:hypothetical protein
MICSPIFTSLEVSAYRPMECLDSGQTWSISTAAGCSLPLVVPPNIRQNACDRLRSQQSAASIVYYAEILVPMAQRRKHHLDSQHDPRALCV